MLCVNKKVISFKFIIFTGHLIQDQTVHLVLFPNNQYRKNLFSENRCSIPHPPAHGRVSFSPDITEFVVGSQIFYSCEAGYQIQGNDSNRTCLTDGTWSGTIPDCVGQYFCSLITCCIVLILYYTVSNFNDPPTNIAP